MLESTGVSEFLGSGIFNEADSLSTFPLVMADIVRLKKKELLVLAGRTSDKGDEEDLECK